MRIAKIRWRSLAYWLTLCCLLMVCVLLLFDNLGVSQVRWADESRHGVNAYEMLRNREFLVSTYRDEVDYWNLKPPLSMYGIMAGYQLFGYNAFGLRAYSAGSMLVTMVILALWTKKRFGSIASLGTLLFLMASPLVYGDHFARFGDADALMALFYVIGLLCMLECPKDIRWLYGSALCFGFAFMAKSWHAALIPITCLAFVCVTGDIKKLKWHQYLLLIFFGLLPVLPWAIARFLYDGLDFFIPMFTTDVVTRATSVHEMHQGEWWYYLAVLLKDPAVLLSGVLCAIAFIRKLLRRTQLHADVWGLALWVAVPLVLYSLCVSKLEWYIFVTLPAFAIALGMVMQRLCPQRKPSNKTFLLRLACLAACFILLLGMSGINLKAVSATRCEDEYDIMMQSFFNRERDAGKHVYIQYESENPYSPIDYRAWMQGEVLVAQLAGDVRCFDGGTAAFVADPQPSYLIAHEVGLETELLEGCEQVYAWGPLKIYKNNF